jgi:hypothetical protein
VIGLAVAVGVHNHARWGLAALRPGHKMELCEGAHRNLDDKCARMGIRRVLLGMPSGIKRRGLF